MKKLNSKALEVLDICLAAESPEVKAKVYEILEIGELDASDPMFLVLALTGQMRVLLEAAPAELSQLLTNWKETSTKSLQLLQEAITQVKSTQQQQADTIKQTLERVTADVVEDIKEAGMATTSAIASANSETLTQAQQTATAAAQLTNAVIALIDKVESDRQTHQLVLQEISQQVIDAKSGLNQAVDRTKGMYGAMEKLQNKIRLSAAIGSMAPLTAIGVAMVAGGVIWAMIMNFYWGEAAKYLSVVRENQTVFNRCFTSDGYMKPGITCTVVAKKKK